MTSATLRHASWILRGNPLTAVAATGVFLFVLVAIFGPWIVPYDPIASDVPQALMPPNAAHWAGTDQLGRDVFSRLLVAVMPAAGSIASSAVSSTC
jgi:peptide/nickel transport system permease protein